MKLLQEIGQQHRYDGRQDFFLTWQEYVNGFGNAHSEYWLGLEAIHQLTSSRNKILRIDLEDKDGNHAFAQYNVFKVASSADNYRLTIDEFTGNASESLQTNIQFSTKDQDNDEVSGDNCAATTRHGGWWYSGSKSCTYSHSNLNGLYSVHSGQNAVFWYDWNNSIKSLKSTKMMIRNRL